MLTEFPPRVGRELAFQLGRVNGQVILIPDTITRVIQRLRIKCAESITKRVVLDVRLERRTQTLVHRQLSTMKRIPKQTDVKHDSGRQLQILGYRFFGIFDVDFFGRVRE